VDERTDELRPQASTSSQGTPVEETSVEVTQMQAGPQDIDDAAPEELVVGIEQTRNELSETINAIQAKLNPENLKEQAVEAVRDAASHAVHGARDHAVEAVRDATVGKAERMVRKATYTANETQTSILDTIKQNPIPSLLAGLSLGWLWRNYRGGSSYNQRSSYDRTYYDRDRSMYVDRNRYAYEDDDEGGKLDRAKEKVGEVASDAKEKVGDLVDQAQYKAGRMADRTQETAGQVAGQAQDTVGQVVDLIRENPIPAAITGVGLGWLLMNSRSSSSTSTPQFKGRGYSSYSTQYPSRYSGQPWSYENRGNQEEPAMVGRVRSAVERNINNPPQVDENFDNDQDKSGLVSTAQEKVSNITGAAQERASDIASSTQQAVGDLTNEAQYQALKLEYRVREMLYEKPLAVGAVAFALGAAVGIAVPGTRQEQKIMGNVRDQVVDKAQEVAQNTMEKVQGVVEEATDTVKEKAREQGLVE